MQQRGRAGVLLLCALAFSALAGDAHAGTLLVLSQTAAKLTALDTATHASQGTLDLPKGPANLTIAPDGVTAYVAHSDLGKVSVVDLPSWSVKATYEAPGSPFGLAASRDGKLYTGDWNGAEVHELDSATGEKLRSATIGKAPAHLALTPDGAYLVAVAREANSVSILDTATFAIVATLPVERAPFALALSHDGTRALVANAQAGSTSTIDLKSRAVTSTTRVGAMPYGIAFTPDDGNALITNQQSGTVAVLAGAEKAASVKVGNYPEGIVITADGKTAFVANWMSDDVSVLEVGAHKEIARVKLPGGPRSLAVTEQRFGQ